MPGPVRSRTRKAGAETGGVGSTAVNGNNNAPIVTTVIQHALGRRTRWLVWAGGTLVILLSLISLAVSLQVRTVGARDDTAFEHIAQTLRITDTP